MTPPLTPMALLISFAPGLKLFIQ